MDMSRVRKVAVRMRPKGQEDGALTPPAPATEAPAPRRVAISAPKTPAAGRNIWDLEEGETERPQETDAPSSHPLVLTDPELPETSKPHTEPEAPQTNRAKTRILGFHAPQVGQDGAPSFNENPAGPVYPAGFLVVVDGPGRGAFFAVTTQVCSIGRGQDQGIALDFGDESISRSGHASVMFDAEQGRFFVGHGNKANAVRRNGTPVLTTEEMAHGDQLRIGKTTLRFHAFCDENFSWDLSDGQDDADE